MVKTFAIGTDISGGGPSDDGENGIVVDEDGDG